MILPQAHIRDFQFRPTLGLCLFQAKSIQDVKPSNLCLPPDLGRVSPALSSGFLCTVRNILPVLSILAGQRLTAIGRPMASISVIFTRSLILSLQILWSFPNVVFF